MRLGDFKLVRQALKTKSPGDWEVYDLANDRGETRNVASQQAALIEQAEALLRREVKENRVFPVPIPGVNKS